MFGFRNFGKTNTSNGIEKLCSALEEADAVIIGAGAGLSTSAGFVYTGERFEKHFLSIPFALHMRTQSLLSELH